ncbi:bifunctional enoyl-CoA hydratase/phosphate acetyltransferase [Rhodoblastus sp. 17X3]|uniref:bifunctional enoyl-CoA hydratase/phosphate acetyltransferase n=1 Tax=Rhodoblastus sp. 17X3 TaxID=3047026 RepID=UPI0024B743BE|nr:bifunctional enoyl-CoA hydratase/phosphate acetyltransferase [Rhodoblastus sp. 17X3]MDI9848498.1 bifunctional enoyl-CoA hydratase/phosphate acetyltransferase [Rhodoblastus sp. 17X3]
MKTVKTISNKTWAQLQVGDTATIERVCADRDLFLFAHVSGNINPLMLPVDEDAPVADAPIAPSMWVGSLISAVLGNILPGPGTLYREQNFEFLNRVHVGDHLRVTVTCREKRAEPTVVFETVIANGAGELVCKGTALIDAPIRNVETPVRELPALIMDKKDHFSHLLALAAQLPRLKTVIVCPESHNALNGPLLAFEKGLIEPIFIGDPERIAKAALELEADLSPFRIIDEKNHRAAADKAVAMVRAGEAGAVMKGDLHSDDLLAAVVKKDGGLRTGRRISHVFVLDTLTLDDLLFVSDAAINIAPDLLTKVDIVQNAIDLALACGVEPKVGVLSAVETVNPAIPSSLDAAILSKMAERGQIRGGVVDGPLAMDNAIDVDAARTKGIASLVAGHANVLIAPNLESGNMLAKELTFVAHAEAAGLVVGASAPVMLTSRADNDKARLVSCALAQLYNYWRQNGHAYAGAQESKALAAE